ncbi:MAG: pyruvate ferredoxin oxidoreductase [Candidatus Woesearchaeota archaeon]
MKKVVAINGDEAAAEAMRQCRPDVVAEYPITPQTIIVETFSKYVADGKSDAEIISAESEHSAISATIGAEAAGARAMTATSSQGLALMFESMVVAPGLRLPILMHVVNRALSAPINIHCDHSDSMMIRDCGWMQLYSETAQEVYDNTFLALRVAEENNLPIMVCQDGFIVSHCVERVEVLDDETVTKFVGEYNPERYLLNTDDPYTCGPLCLVDSYFEVKKEQSDAMLKIKQSFIKNGKELSKITGRKYDVIETYNLDKAKYVIVVLSSTASVVRSVIDKLGSKDYGLVKINLFRPFPYEEVRQALSNAKVVAVMDRAMSYGANAPVYGEVMNALYGTKVSLQSYVFGLGGRDIYEKDVENVFKEISSGKLSDFKYIGVKK